MIKRIKELICILNNASEAYYKYDKPIMSDKEYDNLMDELELLEKESGCVMSNSPLHKVNGDVLEFLPKVKHSKQMLSANKTKDMNVVRGFISKNTTVESWKLDGLTIVCRYEKGCFAQAITRGSNGIEGEDVTKAFRHCINLPLQLSMPINLEVRGECVISWDNFNKINEKLEEPYSHPRNLAAGSVRNLNTDIAKERYLEYKVFELVSIDGVETLDVVDSFADLQRLGFDVVEHKIVTVKNYIEVDAEYFDPNKYEYPVDGTIYKYNSYEYGKRLGRTERYPLNMLARKWNDETYETVFKEIEWNTTRTGLINPIGIFEPVEIEGSNVTRATLHNLSFIEELELGSCDIIEVYKANKIIPKIHNNLTRSNTWNYPDKCPCCGMATEIHNENGSKTLHCTNNECSARLISRLTHFVKKECMNIDGLSEATLEKFISKGWIKNFADIYMLHLHEKEMQELEGFGKKSVEKLLQAIDESKNTDLAHFLNAIGIPGCGKSTSKDIADYCNGDVERFYDIVDSGSKEFLNINGIGDSLIDSLNNWYNTSDYMNVFSLTECYINFDVANNKKEKSSNVDLSGKTFVITGSLNNFANREELTDVIVSLGGKVSSSVTKNTFALINNDVNSASGKNNKAKQLNVQIISEDEFLKIINKY